MPVLQAVGKKFFLLGPNGAGQTVKLAMNMILALQVEAFSEALALVTGSGVGGEKLVEVLQSSMARSGRPRRENPRDSEGRIQGELSAEAHAQRHAAGAGAGEGKWRAHARRGGSLSDLQFGERLGAGRSGFFGGSAILEESSLA